MIIFDCPSCSHLMIVKEEYAGKTGKCKHCGQRITVPVQAIDTRQAPAYTPGPADLEPSPPNLLHVYVRAPRINAARRFVMIISGVGMISTFLPWSTIPIIASINGTGTDAAGDGWLSFVLFLFCVLFTISGETTQKMSETSKFFIIVLSAAAIGLFCWKCSSIRDAMDTGYREYTLARVVQFGIGLYLVGVCGLLNVITLMILDGESKQ